MIAELCLFTTIAADDPRCIAMFNKIQNKQQQQQKWNI